MVRESRCEQAGGAEMKIFEVLWLQQANRGADAGFTWRPGTGWDQGIRTGGLQPGRPHPPLCVPFSGRAVNPGVSPQIPH